MNTRKKKFRYCLRKRSTGLYYYEAARSVFTTATVTALRKDPLDWRETDLQWKRHSKYHGIFRQFAVPFSFTQDGATILRHIFYTQEGIESDCQIDIYKLNATTDQYELWYSGDIDFSQKVDTRDYFQTAILDSGLATLLKANESTPYEMPVYDGDSLNVHLDSLRLKNTSVLSLANDFLVSNSSHQMMPTIAIQSNESEIQVDVIEQPVQQVLGTNTLIPGHPFYRASIDGTVNVDYNISIQVGNSAGSSLATHSFVMVIVKRTVGGVNTVSYLYTNANFTSYVGLNVAAGTRSFAMQAGDTLTYFAGLSSFNPTTGTDAFLVDQTYNYSTLKVYYDLKLPQSVVKAYRYAQVFEKLVDKLTNSQYTGFSSFLTNGNLDVLGNKPWNTLVTSGDGLRRLGWNVTFGNYFSPFQYLSTEKIRTTFDDLLKDASTRWCVGIGIENDLNGNPQIRLEHLSHFYDDTTIIADIGEVNKVEVGIALEYIYNLLKIGYAPQDYDSLNGKDEFNNTSTFALPILRHPAEWNMVSPYRADMYGIEFTRANLIDKKTTDAKSDNDTFLIEVSDNPISVTVAPPVAFGGFAYPLARKQNSSGNSASGLLAPDTAFNLSLSPKRNLLRNGPVIHAALYQQDAKSINFQTADKNAEIISKLGAQTVTENAAVPVVALDAPLFLPYIFTFETKVPVDLPTLIAANPYGKIQFSYLGNTYSGFILEAGIRPADNAVYTWKLLASPTTNITMLIH